MLPDMADSRNSAVDGSEVRIVPGRVLDSEAVVVRRRQLEELDLARRAVDAADQESRDILEKSRQEAHQERARGYEEGLAKARQEVAVEAVALRAEAVRLRAEAGDRLIRLAVELARRVLHHELHTAPDAVEGLARDALAQVSWCQRITLRLHPDDAHSLEATQPRLAEGLDPGAELRLETDPALPRGACLVETEAGDVDASVEVQLAALERALLGEGSEPLPPTPGDPSGVPHE
jgi:flagellar biosynthesis/type III secretory pathway protein FliH